MELLGAHMSIAGGHALAIDRATSFGMTACQIFTKNANQWHARPIAQDAAEDFRARVEASDVAFIVAHDSYLINLASPDAALRERSVAAFGDELARCALLGVPWLVTHPGAHMGSGVDDGVARVAEALNHLFDEQPEQGVAVLLETTAGQGTSLGRSFDELASILEKIEDQSRVGVCFDTCHVFAAGYEIRDEVSYDATMHLFDQILGLHRLQVFHLNDSKKGLGSHVDRHTHIGEGDIGLDAFRMIVNDERFASIPGILETPKDDSGDDDRRNLQTLRDLRRQLAETPAR
jgi:deoxyribonuclease-4